MLQKINAHAVSNPFCGDPGFAACNTCLLDTWIPDVSPACLGTPVVVAMDSCAFWSDFPCCTIFRTFSWLIGGVWFDHRELEATCLYEKPADIKKRINC